MTQITANTNKRWIVAFWFYFAVLITIFALAYLRLIPTEIAKIPFYDTIGHFILYGMTGYLAHRALNRPVFKFINLDIPLGPVLISLFALVEEALQFFSPYRTFSLLDLASNFCGILLFYWIDLVLPPFKEINLINVIQRFIKLLSKMALSAVFPFSVFLTLGLTNKVEFSYIHRYDFLFIFFIVLQIVLILLKFETKDDLKVVLAFHILGLFMEMYKVYYGAWSYPEPAWTKVYGVPLYSGFMYGSVAGFLIQLWKRLGISLNKWPTTSIVSFLALVIYLNFFSMEISKGFRTFLVLSVLFLFFRSRIEFVNTTKRRSIPLIVTFTGLGVFVWIAENIATYLGAWAYPYQLKHWEMVHLSKINSWFLLGVVCFILVAQLLKRGRNIA